ncbi:MAG: dienelactone hydrolase family protein [Phycisphaeraceae bacterium]|nr:dienelactone hydrolase family protein [Phycisphaeraceae bacterium]
MRLFLITAMLVLASALQGCAGPGAAASGAAPEDYYHWRPAPDAKGWAVFLPGSSGLTVLDDDHHYFDAAERLCDQGWQVLLVDYKPAYRASGDKARRSTGEKIAWVTEQAILWMRRNHPETAATPGALVAWSLGAEGAIRIANDPELAASLGLRAAAMYYPSNEDHVALRNRIPLLILTGASDDVTPADEIRTFVEESAEGAAEVVLRVYPECHHGFDIASISQKKTLRILPLIGPKATLQYNQNAAEDAWRTLVGFLGANATAHNP